MSEPLDLLVVGGGFAGLWAAARAAEAGARVAIVEKGSRLGGSAAYAAGAFWTAPDFETLRQVVPGGDPDLGRVLVDGYQPAVERIRSRGVSVTEQWQGQMGFGVACRVDIDALLKALQAEVEAGGGRISLGQPARELLVDRDGRVRGARVATTGGIEEIAASSVLLATGGFQGDPELVAAFIGSPADTILVRSNPWSVGDGFRLGRAAGAAASRCLGGFYGHLLPSPLAELRPEQFLPLTQYYSNRSILINRLGRRFIDESLEDQVSNQAVVRQPGARAILLCDQRVRSRFAATAAYPYAPVIDRVANAIEAGGRVAEAQTVTELVRAVSGWGVDGPALRQTLKDYAAAAAGRDVALDAPLPAEPGPLLDPPFFALEVQPSITFTFGGLAVNVDGRVLDRDGAPVPGLFAAGADAGGLQDHRYVGGLVLGAVFGPRAAEAALGITENRSSLTV